MAASSRLGKYYAFDRLRRTIGGISTWPGVVLSPPSRLDTRLNSWGNCFQVFCPWGIQADDDGGGAPGITPYSYGNHARVSHELLLVFRFYLMDGRRHVRLPIARRHRPARDSQTDIQSGKDMADAVDDGGVVTSGKLTCRSVSTILRHFRFAFREQPPLWTPLAAS